MKTTQTVLRNSIACIVLLIMPASGLLVSASSPPSRVTAQRSEKSLYERVGGYDKLAAIVDDLIGRLVGDPRFEKFFAGFSVDSKKRIRQHLLDQLCNATGGHCVYTTHGGLGITEADWDAGVKHLTAAIDKAKGASKKVHPKEKGQLLAFVGTLKKDIVEK
jgi:hemoglobin